MQRPPRDRIALNGEPLLPKLLLGVEARRQKKRCHEASDTISCTRGRWQASQTSARRQAGHCRAHGKVVQLTCAPHGGQPARRLTVEDVALVLSPAVSATPRPSAAGSRRLRRCAALLTRSVSSSRLTPTTPCRRLRFIEICGTSQVFGMIVLQEDNGTSRVATPRGEAIRAVLGAIHHAAAARSGAAETADGEDWRSGWRRAPLDPVCARHS
jgi:hypothetical protein